MSSPRARPPDVALADPVGQPQHVRAQALGERLGKTGRGAAGEHHAQGQTPSTH